MGTNPQRRQIGRYDKLPGVRIKASRVPAPLRPLLPIARKWGILSDDKLRRAIRCSSRQEIVRAVEATKPLKAAIYDFAYRSRGASATPVPHEVVLFQMFSWSVNRLEAEVR